MTPNMNYVAARLPFALETLPAEVVAPIFAQLAEPDGSLSKKTLRLRLLNKATRKRFDQALNFPRHLANTQTYKWLGMDAPRPPECNPICFENIVLADVTKVSYGVQRLPHQWKRKPSNKPFFLCRETINLAELTLSNCPNQTQLLRFLPQQRSLTHLSLSGTTRGETTLACPSILSLLQIQLNQLRSLTLQHMALGEANAETFACLTRAPLQTLVVAYAHLNNDGVHALLSLEMAALTNLSLVGNDFTDLGLASFADTARTRLKWLDLSGNAFGSEGVAHLRRATDFCPHVLNVDKTALTPAEAYALGKAWPASLRRSS